MLPGHKNLLNLNDDQKVELEIKLIHLQGRAIITDGQQTQVIPASLFCFSQLTRPGLI
jgi:hypothetical protein